MKSLAPWSLATLVLLGSGCAGRPDWIQSTLVTVDVAGVWEGRASGPAGTWSVTLILEQRGPKVTGKVLGNLRGSGALEGRVEGDVFRFAQTFGAMRGEATVAGDEMTGELDGFGVAGGRSTVLLQRAGPGDTVDREGR